MILNILKSGGYTVFIGRGHTHELNSILCAFTTLAGGSKRDKTKGFRFHLDEATQSEDSMSIMFCIFKEIPGKRADKVSVADVEIRYKGKPTAPPNYQAKITQQFKNTILQGCPPGGH